MRPRCPRTGRRRAAVGSQPWPLGHREPPPPPGHDLRRRCLSDAHDGPSNNAIVNHTACHHLPSGFRQVQGGSALCHGSGRSDPRGRRARLRAFPEPSLQLHPPHLAILRLARPLPPHQSPNGSLPAGRSMKAITASPLPRPRILENLPVPSRPGEHANDKREMTLVSS